MGLKVKNLVLHRESADGSRHLMVDALDFDLTRGSTLALCGPSGSGKTSVALSVLDLLPHGVKRSAGEVTIDEVPFQSSWRGSRIGLIFQEPRLAFHPLFTVGRLFAERLRLAGVAANRLRSESIGWLERIGLEDAEARLEDRACHFSGGELQRIMIAMALSQNPEFLIADEPTSNLDVLVQGKILGLMKRLQAQLDLGILLITHDKRVATAMTSQHVQIQPEFAGVRRDLHE